jgi:DNA mismatch endonuclease, patch repair protein
MADRLNDADRSALMARIRSRNTAPELSVRRLLHALGYRYSANVAGLPGSPDLAFMRRKKAIFVHGCFWHSHNCGRGFKPKANAAFWEAKFSRNVARDRRVLAELEAMGWRAVVVYECELRGPDIEELTWRLIAFLEDDAATRQGGAQMDGLDK